MASFYCDQCGNGIIVHAIVDSEVWEQIAEGAYALCPACMDVRIHDKGIVCECDLQFNGRAMRSVLTQRVLLAGGWRPREFIVNERIGIDRLYGKQ
jgi:hypothetical protein